MVGSTELGLTLKKLRLPMTAEQRIAECLEILPGVPADEPTVKRLVKFFDKYTYHRFHKLDDDHKVIIQIEQQCTGRRKRGEAEPERTYCALRVWVMENRHCPPPSTHSYWMSVGDDLFHAILPFDDSDLCLKQLLAARQVMDRVHKGEMCECKKRLTMPENRRYCEVCLMGKSSLVPLWTIKSERCAARRPGKIR